MAKAKYLPNYREYVMYNTNDLRDDFVILGQGMSSGSMYILEFDEDNKLVEWELMF